MTSDVEIKIFGTVTDPEAVWELASSAAAEGRINWLEEIRMDGFLDLLQQAEGRALTLTRGRTTDFFEGVREACRDAGLSYVVTYGVTGAEGYTDGFSWRPGLAEEFPFTMDGKLPTLKLADVQAAALRGPSAVAKLVSDTEEAARVGKIEIAPGFAEAYREHVGETAAAPAP